MHIRTTAAVLMLLAFLCALSAAAAAGLPALVRALIETNYPGYAVTASAGGGSDAQGQFALVLSRDGHNVLCIAEKAAGDAAYSFTVDTDTAVRQGEQIPELLIDTGGDALFYSYREETGGADSISDYTYRYHAVKTQSGWGDVDIIVHLTETARMEDYDSVRDYETAIRMDNSNLMITSSTSTEGEGETYTHTTSYAPVYAPWLEGSLALSAFDIAAWPLGDADAPVTPPMLAVLPEWPAYGLDGLFARSVLAVLPDGYTVNDVKLSPAALMAEAQDARGVRTLVIIETARDGARRVTQSTPIPEGVRPDLFHSGNSVLVKVYPAFSIQEDYSIYSFRRRADGTWRLYNAMTDDGIFNYIAFGLEDEQDRWYVGDGPAIDLTAADWGAMPVSFAQAMSALDQSGWARVISDDPRNRLHLRAAPDRGAESLGKYYQGTPVRVLGSKGEWTEVDVFGAHGYMMTKWLAFGADMNGVESAFLWLTYQPAALEAGIPVYASPSDSVAASTLAAALSPPDPVILGVVGNAWYHIVIPEIGLSGYVRQDALWGGHG